MSVKGSRKQFCKYGHDKSLPGNTTKAGGCNVCNKANGMKAYWERNKPKQASVEDISANSPWNKV